jgi:hypothetical protein
MATPVNELPALDPDSGSLNVVDTPKGSRNKYKFDEEHGQWRLSKILPEGLSFPCNFGFLPSTHGEDGDPVDVLVVMEEPAFPGWQGADHAHEALKPAAVGSGSRQIQSAVAVGRRQRPLPPADCHCRLPLVLGVRNG